MGSLRELWEELGAGENEMKGWDNVRNGTDKQRDWSAKCSRATVKPFLKTILVFIDLVML